MECIICGKEIRPGDGCTVPGYYAIKHVPDRYHQNERRNQRRDQIFPGHVDCIDYPADLGDRHFAEWAGKALLKERTIRAELQRKLDEDIQIIHRALHNLPDELITDYIAEAYGENR